MIENLVVSILLTKFAATIQVIKKYDENLYNKIENIESIKTDIASQARVSFLFEKYCCILPPYFNITIVSPSLSLSI